MKRLTILQGMQVLTILYLFMLTLMPVEVRWAEADVWLLWSLFVLFGMGLFKLLLKENVSPLENIDGVTAIRANSIAHLTCTDVCLYQHTLTDVIVTIWFFYYFLRIYVGGEYPCATDFLKTCSIALLYVVLRIVFSGNRISEWWLILVLIVCGVYETFSGICQMICGTSRHHLFSITGNFLNPGPYSAYIMIGSVVGLYALQEKNEVLGRIDFRKILLVLTATMLVVLPSTWSRAAFVGLGICVLCIYRDRYWKYKYLVLGTLCLLAVALYFIKQGSAEGRVVTWVSSFASWLYSPWVGVGIGGFRHACAEGIAEMWASKSNPHFFDSAGVTDYAYNDLLKILVEQGLVGAVLCVLVVFSTMSRLHKQSKPLFMGMMSLLVFSMFSYPFELLPYRIITVVVCAWSESGFSFGIDISSSSERKANANAELANGNANLNCHSDGKPTPVLVAVCALVIFNLLLLREVQHRREVDKDCNLFSGMHNSAFIDDYYELLPDELDNPQYLFDFAKTLRESKRYRDSNAVLNMGTLISADPMFYMLIGNNYRDEQFFADAEKAYRKAFAIMPNRLYPLYQLMLMYEENKNMVKARTVAKQILELEPKVKSPATDEMK